MSQGFTKQNGNVQGADSSTDNAFAKFDGTTGKILQNSKMIEDDTGIISSSQSAVYVRNTTSQTIPHVTFTKLVLDNVQYDIQSEFDTINYRFTATKSGIYLVSANVRWGNGSTERTLLSLYKNGVEMLRGEDVTIGTDSQFRNPTVTGVIQLVAGDYLELYIYQKNISATSQTIDEGAFFFVHKLS